VRQTTTLHCQQFVIYLDYNATTPVLPAVWTAMEPYFGNKWGNPSSAHSFGLKARQAIDRARAQVALLVGADTQQIVFTCSATEANNTALSAGLQARGKRRKVVTPATEHSAVLNFCAAKARGDVEVQIVPVHSSGVVDMAWLSEALTPDTAVASIMWANNETGVVNPVEQVSELCLERDILFHCDAVQAAGKLPIDLRTLSIDYLTVSAHKIFGPKGAGALVLGNSTPFTAMLYGGHQENDRRGGTENVPAIIGFGRAAELAMTERVSRSQHVREFRDELQSQILAEVPGTYVNGANAPRIPNTTNIGFEGIDSETLVSLLDQEGICVSSGSACLSDSITPSHVVQAMTGSYKKAGEAIRFSLSHLNNMRELEEVTGRLRRVVSTLR
jgi:cysteine desulfurase